MTTRSVSEARNLYEMGEGVVELSPAHQAEPNGPLAIAIGLVTRPRTTWSTLYDARNRWLWVPALLVLVLTTLGAYAFVRADAGYRYDQALAWYERQPEGQLRSPELQVPTADLILNRAGAQSLGVLARWAVWAALLFAVSRLGGARPLTPADAATLTLWGWVPYAFRGLVQLAYTAVTRTPIYNPGIAGMLVDNTPPSLMGFRYTAPTGREHAVSALLAGVDIFSLWQSVLMAKGLVTFTQLPHKRARVISFALWVLLLLLNLVVL
ncbi:MAG: YIP1 family protein [Anaerolineae bacterium]